MSHVYRLPHIRLTASSGLMAILSTVALLMLPLPLAADGPGRGLTAQFEIDFLKFTIDHHFGALRVTELAAGTDTKRNADISSKEGTSNRVIIPFPPVGNEADRVQLSALLLTFQLVEGVSFPPQMREGGQPSS